MPLEMGTRVGVYEVTGKLGEGGMGEVYRAHDTTLDRDVALKVLSEAFTADPDRLARFQREAKVLASLNHPNIGGIYGLEAAGESQALVLELIEGPTLADRIKEGVVPVDEALGIAKQIGDALEIAHDQGIVHRDLKPANVKIRPDGTVKVLDFGLAKAVTPDTGNTSGAESPTISITGSTQVGMVVGTAAYMSPEQAKGKAVDKRTDVWAFGAVLYEMLTGRKAFPGDDVSDTLASVLAREPAEDALPATVPQAVRRLLTRCFEKDPKKRLRDVSEGFVQLEDAMSRPGLASNGNSLNSSLQFWQRPVAALGVAAMVALGSALAVLGFVGPDETTGLPTRFTLAVPDGTQLSIAQDSTDVAISPDGRSVAYLTGNGVDVMGVKELHLRELDDFTPITLAEGEPLYSPFFSPDNQWLGFYSLSANELRRVSVTGGSAIPIAQMPAPMRGASWGDDDSIVYATNEAGSGLFRVSASRGEPESLTVPDIESGVLNHFWPQVLPGSQAIVYTNIRTPIDDSEIVAMSLETGEQKVVVTGGFHGRYVNSGHLLYAVGNTLRAIIFDIDTLETTGGPISVVDGLLTKTFGGADFEVSQNGSLVYVPGVAARSSGIRNMVWVDRQGQEEELDAPPGPYDEPRLSPDGRYVALTMRSPDNTDVMVYDLQRNTPTRLTFEPGVDRNPLWSSDGQRILFQSDRDGSQDIYSKAADGTGQAERVTTNDMPVYPSDLTSDDKSLAVWVVRGSADIEVYAHNPDGLSEQVQASIRTDFIEAFADVSPDGQWVTYTSNESGQFEVYVRPFPNVDDGRWQISRNGGQVSVWSHDGQELFFRDFRNNQMMVVDITADSTFTPGNPEVLFTGSYRGWSGFDRMRSYDISANSDRFLMIKEQNESDALAAVTPIIYVQNWIEELKERLPLE